MAITERLQRFLDEERVPYQVLPHREEFTAQQVAAAAHVPGRHLAKVLLVRDQGGNRAVLVLPAPCRVDLGALKLAGFSGRLALATEEEIGRTFPDCEVGAMPPFGNLYGLPVYADDCFARAEELVFQGGNHREAVRVRYADFERLARPTVGEFCLHAREKLVNE